MAVACLALGQANQNNFSGTGSGVSIYTVANLPTGQSRGKFATVSDGSSASDCTVGSGTSAVACIYTGSAWAFAGSSASGVNSLATSTTNSVGLTATPSATTGSNIKVEITGAAPSFGTSVTAPVVNASTGFQVAGAAPNAHCLIGNGTDYVDSASCGGAGGDTITSPNSTLTVGGTSSATSLDLVGSAGKIMAGATPALTFTPALGVDNTNAGTLQLANGSAAAHTIFGSAATTSNTILGFATAPTTGHIVDCTVASTTCTLHDSGIATASVNTTAAVANPPLDKSGTGLSNPTADATFTYPVGSTTGLTLAGTAPASVSTSTGTNATSLFNISGVTGGADSNATGTAGVGSSPTVTAGNGGAGTGTNAVGGAGGSAAITAGNGGASLGTGANANGGNVNITPGTAGSGGSGAAGKAGVVQILGPGAGFDAYQQGTANTTANTNIPANSIIEQAPTAVTAYTLTKPAAAPVIASYKQTDTCGSAICTESYHPAPIVLTVTSDFTTAANTSLQTITGLTKTMPVSQAVVVNFHCQYTWQQATAPVAVAFGIQGATTAPTNLEASATSYSNTTAETTGTLFALTTTTATAIVSVAPSAITTVWKAVVDGTLEAPSNASPTVLNFMVSTATSGDAVTVKRGSSCSLIFQ